MSLPALKLKTSRIAAFFVLVMLISGCQQGDLLNELSQDTCGMETIAISSIQGASKVTPLLGEAVTTIGVVTHLDQPSGLYIEMPSRGQSADTSAGLFVQSPALATMVSAGDRLLVSGIVAETGDGSDTLTSLIQLAGYRVCAKQQTLPVTKIELPLTEQTRESLEGMHLRLDQQLFVTDPRSAGKGLLTLSVNGILPQPTEIALPGKDARAQAAINRRATLRISLAGDEDQHLPAGTTVLSINGVLGNDGRGSRLMLKTPLHTIPVRVNRTKPPAENNIRIVGLNLHNYFNGDGNGGEFPTPRGAKTPAEFSQQRGRLSAAIEHIQPHLVAVMELENDGFGPDSAADDFIQDLQNASGQTWQVVAPLNGPIGGDVITVGIFYRADKLDAIGKAALLTSPEFQRRSRVPIAQKFANKTTGESFLAVVNHLKSKGSCPQDGINANLKDGQGCWNQARTAAATVMAKWAQSLANATTAGKVLILGDMNAYRMEDPITAVLDAGFHDLKASSGLRLEFSYIYSGEAGTLDYAFASPQLRPNIQSAMILNFNSIYARELDLPLPWLGSSDHDPVVVDLRFRQPSTSD